MAQKKVDTGPAVTSGGPEGDVSAELFIGMISLRTCPERRAFFEHGWREQVGMNDLKFLRYQRGVDFESAWRVGGLAIIHG